MTEEEELALAALATGVTKGETTSEEVFRPHRYSGANLGQDLHRLLRLHRHFRSTVRRQRKLSRGTEAEITQAVLDAAKYAPAHFKMW